MDRKEQIHVPIQLKDSLIEQISKVTNPVQMLMPMKNRIQSSEELLNRVHLLVNSMEIIMKKLFQLMPNLEGIVENTLIKLEVLEEVVLKV